jgi:hypothetical protein
MTADTGKVETDRWQVYWDHTGPGQLTWNVRDRDEGYEYVARRDDGWRIAPRGHTTVDNEVLLEYLARTELVPEEGWRDLLALLEGVA